jgi:hypothetical protein
LAGDRPVAYLPGSLMRDSVSVSGGWPVVVSSLESLPETGDELPAPPSA